MLGYLAGKAPICGQYILQVGAFLCLVSVATGACSQHKGSLLDNEYEKIKETKIEILMIIISKEKLTISTLGFIIVLWIFVE